MPPSNASLLCAVLPSFCRRGPTVTRARFPRPAMRCTRPHGPQVEVREQLTQLKLLDTLNDIFDFIFWEKKRNTSHISQSLVSAIASVLGSNAPDTGTVEVSAVNSPLPAPSPTAASPAAVPPAPAPAGAMPPSPEPQHGPTQPDGFGPSHPVDSDCRPDAARRIQYLRLIHKYCDCADYHHLHKADPETRESKRKLARKMVACLLRHRSDTNCRYWLASCLEAVLRGNHWKHRRDDQVSIAEEGVLCGPLSSSVARRSRTAFRTDTRCVV